VIALAAGAEPVGFAPDPVRAAQAGMAMHKKRSGNDRFTP
jgi:hypothetical protein